MKIALIGYGKMGKMIEQIAKDRGHEIVSIIDIDNQQDFESEAFASADVAIEFTSPQAAYGNFQKAFAKNVKVVSGSTGWMEDHAEDVKKIEGRRTDALLGQQLLGGRRRFLGREPLSGQNHERFPTV